MTAERIARLYGAHKYGPNNLTYIEIEELFAAFKEALADRERLDWLVMEVDREMRGVQIEQSLFRRNQPITREAIDFARAASRDENK